MLKSAEAERKFLVFESHLLELFRLCPQCLTPCKKTVSTKGSLVSVQSECPCHHVNLWSSQPLLQGNPVGDMVLKRCFLHSLPGSSSTIKMLHRINVQILSDEAYDKREQDIQSSAEEQVSVKSRFVIKFPKYR